MTASTASKPTQDQATVAEAIAALEWTATGPHEDVLYPDGKTRRGFRAWAKGFEGLIGAAESRAQAMDDAEKQVAEYFNLLVQSGKPLPPPVNDPSAEDEPLNVQMNTRITESQRDRTADAAELLGVSNAEYVRMLLEFFNSVLLDKDRTEHHIDNPVLLERVKLLAESLALPGEVPAPRPKQKRARSPRSVVKA